jgi:ubiquinone/menaquinone biosynthesis C-methylase UbiE
MAAPPTEHQILDVNRRYHDVAAESYDAKWGISFGEIGHQQVLGKVTKLLGPEPGPYARSLEIGAGTGYFSLNLAQTGVVGEATCTDISPGMLATLERNAAALGLDVETAACDAAELPFDDESFDLVLGHAVLHHLPDLDRAFAEFRRVLKPGGYLHVHTAPNLYFMKYGWPASRPFVKLIGHKEIADKVDEWFKIAEDYHVNEQSVHSMRKALKGAGFEQPHVWLDPDVLRGGKFHLLEGFDSLPVRIAKNIAGWRPVRLFMSNDVLAVAHK